MVDIMIDHLAKHNKFWRQIVCRAEKPSISPCVKFLCGLKMLCYGVSASDLFEYFQMGKSRLRTCLSKLTQGIVERNSLANVYLQRPTKLDARNKVSLHEKVRKIRGMMGLLDVTKVHWRHSPTA